MGRTRIEVLLAAAMVVVTVVAMTATVGMFSTSTAQPTAPADVVYAQGGRP